MTMGVEFQAVSKRYESAAKSGSQAAQSAKPAVDEISFQIQKGTLTTLLGPSGCGKTTSLRMIAGLETPSSGRVLIDGKDVTHLGPSQRPVSLVFQSYALFPHMNVLENVAYGPSVSGDPKARAQSRAKETLASVGLEGYESRMPSELSGGQQQRVAVARALVLQPSVLLFDEPLSNLDARLRRQMREEIRALQQRFKLTVAYVTHDQSEALAVSDQIIVMNQGQIAQAGSPRELYERPRSEFVAKFMGEAVLMKAEKRGDAWWLGSLRVPALQGLEALTGSSPAVEQATVAIRPEAWVLSKTPRAEMSHITAKVKQAVYLGGSYEYVVTSELGEIFIISALQSEPVQVGEQVYLGLSVQGLAILSE